MNFVKTNVIYFYHYPEYTFNPVHSISLFLGSNSIAILNILPASSVKEGLTIVIFIALEIIFVGGGDIFVNPNVKVFLNLE